MHEFAEKFASLTQEILQADRKVDDAKKERDELFMKRFLLMREIKKIIPGVYRVWGGHIAITKDRVDYHPRRKT